MLGVWCGKQMQGGKQNKWKPAQKAPTSMMMPSGFEHDVLENVVLRLSAQPCVLMRFAYRDKQSFSWDFMRR
jgi:hypothetical protein